MELCLIVEYIVSIVILIIIIIKTSSTGPYAKNKIVYKLISQLQKHLSHGCGKTQLSEATNDWLLP